MLQNLEKSGKITQKGFTEIHLCDSNQSLIFVLFVKTVEGYRVKSLS